MGCDFTLSLQEVTSWSVGDSVSSPAEQREKAAEKLSSYPKCLLVARTGAESGDSLATHSTSSSTEKAPGGPGCANFFRGQGSVFLHESL